LHRTSGMERRTPDIAVISDVHLGTYGCHAAELSAYLDSITPGLLIINGDFIDGWNFSRNYFPPEHLQVIRHVLRMLRDGVNVVYISGNHDEFLRRFADFKMGNLRIADKLILVHEGKVHWFFHGDIFDITMKYSKLLAKLGGRGYDLLILVNRFVNRVLEKFGREKLSLSKRIKNSVKKAVKFIDDFETTACELAIDQKYDVVICGHIHQYRDRIFQNEKGSVHYLNSGDWVENLTSLECENGNWKVVDFSELEMETVMKKPEEESAIGPVELPLLKIAS